MSKAIGIESGIFCQGLTDNDFEFVKKCPVPALNQMLKQLDYTTEENVKVVHGNLSSSRDWQSGKYKVETQINGVSARTVNFTVE